jgi:hypothetical protein
MTYPSMSHIHIDIGQHFVSLAGGRKYASRSGGSSSRRVASSGSSRYERYARDYDYEPRSYGRSQRYSRQASYERGYSSGYSYGSGNSDYSRGYATMYRYIGGRGVPPGRCNLSERRAHRAWRSFARWKGSSAAQS